MPQDLVEIVLSIWKPVLYRPVLKYETLRHIKDLSGDRTYQWALIALGLMPLVRVVRMRVDCFIEYVVEIVVGLSNSCSQCWRCWDLDTVFHCDASGVGSGSADTTSSGSADIDHMDGC